MRERTTDEYKEAVIQRLIASPLSFRQFAIEEGIAHATLHKWKKRFNVGAEERTVHRSSDRWSSQEKFTVVLECATLSEVELGEYCRRKGLYVEQVALWREACIQGNMKSSDQQKKAKSESSADKKRIKQLEQELVRKDKALAEAAALLVLGKKLDALRKENGDD